MGLDQTPPALIQNVNVDAEETYYVAIFGTGRVWHDAEGDPILPGVPPSILNFPHDPYMPGTEDSDLRPLVGGRVNRPGPPIDGLNPGDADKGVSPLCGWTWRRAPRHRDR